MRYDRLFANASVTLKEPDRRAIADMPKIVCSISNLDEQDRQALDELKMAAVDDPFVDIQLGDTVFPLIVSTITEDRETVRVVFRPRGSPYASLDKDSHS